VPPSEARSCLLLYEGGALHGRHLLRMRHGTEFASFGGNTKQSFNFLSVIGKIYYNFMKFDLSSHLFFIFFFI